MKVLTIKEPWATLIIDGYKKYEFRSWKTNYRGKILIHAGMSEEKDMLKKFKDYNLNCSKGMIIGEALLTDCILVTKKFEDELLKIDKTVYGRESHERNDPLLWLSGGGKCGWKGISGPGWIF